LNSLSAEGEAEKRRCFVRVRRGVGAEGGVEKGKGSDIALRTEGRGRKGDRGRRVM